MQFQVGLLLVDTNLDQRYFKSSFGGVKNDQTGTSLGFDFVSCINIIFLKGFLDVHHGSRALTLYV